MLTNYDLFDDVVRLHDVFEEFFKDVPSWNNRTYDFPYVNVYENGDNLEIKAIVPGVTAEDLHIELIDNGLKISGERKSDLEDKPYIRKERSFGKFNKSVRLPYRVKRDAINAELKDGVLVVHLEKSEEAKPRKIEIK